MQGGEFNVKNTLKSDVKFSENSCEFNDFQQRNYKDTNLYDRNNFFLEF